MPSRSVSKAPAVVRVVIPAKVANNLALLQKAVASSIADIVGRYGCPGCHSGIDFQFVNESEFVVNARTLKPVSMSEAET